MGEEGIKQLAMTLEYIYRGGPGYKTGEGCSKLKKIVATWASDYFSTFTSFETFRAFLRGNAEFACDVSYALHDELSK